MSAGLFCAVLLTHAPANADSGEQLLTPSLRFAALSAEESTLSGPLLSLHYARGMNLSWWLRGGVDLMALPIGDGDVKAAAATVGVLYAFDVLHFIPYATANVGLLSVSGLAEPVQPIADFSAGLDWLFTRQRSIGVFAGALVGADLQILSLGLRLSKRWGFF